jgi:hypothetical protein
MGKAAKGRKAATRKLKKKAAKAAKKALYASYAGTGKRKKKQDRKTGPTTMKGAHVMQDCGNVGCGACYPQFQPKPALLAG